MFPDYTYLPESTQVINRKSPDTCFRVAQRPDRIEDTNIQGFIEFVMPRYKFEDAFINCRVPKEIYNAESLTSPQDYFIFKIEDYLKISRREVVLKWKLEKIIKEYKDTYNKNIIEKVNKYIETLTIYSNEYIKFISKFEKLLAYFKNEKYKFNIKMISKAYKYEDYIKCGEF
jgi:hypothetical protein